MINIIENKEVIEIQSPMPTGRRILFGIIALFPLIAPYELIIKPQLAKCSKCLFSICTPDFNWSDCGQRHFGMGCHRRS
jgi:hypothetical protein